MTDSCGMTGSCGDTGSGGYRFWTEAMREFIEIQIQMEEIAAAAELRAPRLTMSGFDLRSFNGVAAEQFVAPKSLADVRLLETKLAESLKEIRAQRQRLERQERANARRKAPGKRANT